jgi:RimJ/RimL family protein N-acetyltransferase
VHVIARPITDEELISSTIRHPRIWPSISDDGCPPPNEFRHQVSDAMIYLGMFSDDEFHGFFMLHRHNAICWEVHTCLLPSAWGKLSAILAGECIEWIFSETECRRLITNVPAGNILAKRLALSVGMTEFGRNPRSFLKNGEAIDQIMLGISKE